MLGDAARAPRDQADPQNRVVDGDIDAGPSTTLPEAAGEHVESLAEWIDERSEAAAASRLRRRANRRQGEGRATASAASSDGLPSDAGDGAARQKSQPAQGAGSATRFPALPGEPTARSFADEGSGLLGGLLSGHRRRNLIIGLVALAVLQLTLSFRDGIASSMPFTRPILAVLGAPLGLKTEPVRSIEDLSIEGFEIQELGRNNQYSVTALIRNRSGRPLRWPAMELSLMDPSRNIVVRKVIEPTTYLGEFARTDGIAPRSEQPIRLTIETRDVRMSGYSVALFYP